MARRLFRKYLPNPDRVRWLGRLGHRPDLWHLNRHSTARAFAVGCFWGLIPIPLQTIPTVLTAIKTRANVPLSWVVTWVIYPVFFTPYLYLTYTIGRLILRRPPMHVAFRWGWLASHFWDIGLPLILGSVIVAAVAAVVAYFTIQWVWTRYTWRRWTRRAHQRFPAGGTVTRAPTVKRRGGNSRVHAKAL